MKIKVSEATGAELDLLVAQCEGYDVVIETISEQAKRFKSALFHDGVAPPTEVIDAIVASLKPILRVRGEYGIHLVRVPAYSTDLAQGGPIIEREITGVDLVSELKNVKKWSARKFEYLPNDQTRCTEQQGPTLLIAAMRCYVTSKLGDYADVPEELANA